MATLDPSLAVLTASDPNGKARDDGRPCPPARSGTARRRGRARPHRRSVGTSRATGPHAHDRGSPAGAMRCPWRPWSLPVLRPGRFGSSEGSPLENGAACRLPERRLSSSSFSSSATLSLLAAKASASSTTCSRSTRTSAISSSKEALSPLGIRSHVGIPNDTRVCSHGGGPRYPRTARRPCLAQRPPPHRLPLPVLVGRPPRRGASPTDGAEAARGGTRRSRTPPRPRCGLWSA